MKKLKVLSLFDGISCGQVALERAGMNVETYYASEIDKNAIKVTMQNYPNTIQLGDITKWKDWDIDWSSIDLLIGGSPCQGFSFAGKQYNFEDPRSKLFFTFIDIKREIEKVNSNIIVLLENNKMKKDYENVISNFFDWNPIKINSSLVSAQNRQRLYWINRHIEVPKDKNILLKDIVGEYKGIWVYPRGYNRGGVQGYKGKSPTITTSSWQHNFKIQINDFDKRMFTPEECEQLQTLPVGYTSTLSDNQRYIAIGNGWTVDVIAHIFKQIL